MLFGFLFGYFWPKCDELLEGSRCTNGYECPGVVSLRQQSPNTSHKMTHRAEQRARQRMAQAIRNMAMVGSRFENEKEASLFDEVAEMEDAE